MVYRDVGRDWVDIWEGESQNINLELPYLSCISHQDKSHMLEVSPWRYLSHPYQQPINVWVTLEDYTHTYTLSDHCVQAYTHT